jgi:hypothetical protein
VIYEAEFFISAHCAYAEDVTRSDRTKSKEKHEIPDRIARAHLRLPP